MRFRNPERQHLFRIKLHGKSDDRFNAAEMLLEHQAIVGKHRPHQVVDAVARLKQPLERHVAEIVMPELPDLFLRDERRSRAHLPVVANDKNFFPAQAAPATPSRPIATPRR